MSKTTTPHDDPSDRYYLSCDWGTSSFRLKLVKLNNSRPVNEISGSRGIKKMYHIWKGQEGTKNRVDLYRSYLKEKVTSLQQATGMNLNGLPIVLSGMASSSIGMKELPYRQLPLDLNHPDVEMETFSATPDFPHDLTLVSGLRSSDDVMRGEETQLLGLVSKLNLDNGLCIFPGTHCKHIFVQNNLLTQFKTYLTGELFGLLCSQSILNNSVSEQKITPDSDAFQRGVQQSVDHNLLHSLFQIRAMDLLQKTSRSENYDFLSGLLIGTELKDLANDSDIPIVLAGENRLQANYSKALDVLQLKHLVVSSSEDLTLMGHNVLINRMEG